MARRKGSLLDWIAGSLPAQSTSRERFASDGVTIEYTLKRSRRRRSITLTIDESGLRVGAPWRASQSRVDTVLVAHAPWITRKLAEWQARRPLPFTWQAGATVMALGESLTLMVDAAITVTTRHGNHLCVSGGADDPARLEELVTVWLRDMAQSWFEQRAAHFARVLDVRVPSIRLSNARTRWGTCHPDGRVHLNWRLIQAPPALVDYVVVHELAHLREPNHSPRFWTWVAGVLPDYRERRQALRRDACRYLLA
ncbi:MAG: SprT family zinc-dependent metalloprotease [Betaproteobacteria bacterium]